MFLIHGRILLFTGIPLSSADAVPAIDREHVPFRTIAESETGHVAWTGAQQFEAVKAEFYIWLQREIDHALQVTVLDRLGALKFPAVTFVDLRN